MVMKRSGLRTFGLISLALSFNMAMGYETIEAKLSDKNKQLKAEQKNETPKADKIDEGLSLSLNDISTKNAKKGMLLAATEDEEEKKKANTRTPRSTTSTTSTDTSQGQGEIKTQKLEAVTTTVTTASGYEQDIRYAPASISVIPKEEILTRPIRDIGDAVQDVPGVYVEASKTGANTITMRGLASSYTLILIDGKRQNVAQGFDANGMSANTSFMPPASMIERIEVIRGPASIIYGSDAMGGVINIITKKDPEKVTTSVQTEFRYVEDTKSDLGTAVKFGNIQGINFYTALPIIKDVLSANLRGKYQVGGQNAFTNPNDTTYHAKNPYLVWSATGYENANLGGRVNYNIDSKNSIYFDLDTYYGRLGSLNTSSSNITAIRDFFKINAILNHDIDMGASVGKVNSYLQLSETFYIPHSDIMVGASSGIWYNWSSLRDNRDIIFQSTYNNLFDLGSWGDLVTNGGVYYMWERLMMKNSGFMRAMNQVALFAEGQWNINEYIGTTLGLRFNYSDIFKAIPNPRFYVNYNPLDWLTVKFGIASGVRVPQLSYLYDGCYQDTNVTQCGNKDLLPETSWSYEISSVADTQYAFGVATIFYTDLRNQIENATLAENKKQYLNRDKSLMAGLELGVNMKPIYGFSVNANYGFTYTRILSGSGAGGPVNSIPMNNITVTPKYKIDIDSKNGLEGYIRWSGRYFTPTPVSSGGSRDANIRGIVGDYYKGYNLVDLAITYQYAKKYFVTFAINNLFNVTFVDLVRYSASNSGSSSSSGSTNSANTASYENSYQRIMPNRNYWLTLRVEI